MELAQGVPVRWLLRRPFPDFATEEFAQRALARRDPSRPVRNESRRLALIRIIPALEGHARLEHGVDMGTVLNVLGIALWPVLMPAALLLLYL